VEERRGHVEEKFGTLPAMAIGYVLPARRTPEWFAMALLDQALHGAGPGASTANWCWKSRLPWKRMEDRGFVRVQRPTQLTTRILHSRSIRRRLRWLRLTR